MDQSEVKNKSFETFSRAFCYLHDRPSLNFAQSLLIIDTSLGLKSVYPGYINC